MAVPPFHNPILLAWYGDDFTGSTDVMEALVRSGIEAVLFLEPPGPEQLARFPGLQAFGLAGTSRTMSLPEMDAELPGTFARLRDSGARIVHYKLCSTFDSSPEVGSIGRALDLGRDVFQCRTTPLMVGAPALGRYSVFGNLFARSGLESEPYRLDRHPTMRQHPITPMDESDLRLHLSRQTAKTIGLLDLLHLNEPQALEHFNALADAGAQVVLFDVLTDQHLPLIGRIIWEESRRKTPLFVAGSSGVEYALTAFWKANPEAGVSLVERAGFELAEVERIAVISGSCSPVTQRQIDWALENGFADVPLDTAGLIDPKRREKAAHHAVQTALKFLAANQSVLLHTSKGPDDPRVRESWRQFAALGLSEHEIKLQSGRLLGPELGAILRRILEQTKLPRAAVAGGDTSSYVARSLGVEALEMAAPMAPGSPLCRAHAPGQAADGMELVFKGGQVGRADFFGKVLGI
jgi:3-oxoisoapionate kinase